MMQTTLCRAALAGLLAACAAPAANPPPSVSAARAPTEIAVPADLPFGATLPGHPPPTPGNLQRTLLGLRGPARLRLEPGHHLLAPSEFVDRACGNCEEPDTPVPATVGVRVSGAGIHLVGSGAAQTIVHTYAGYGVLFEECDDCELRDLTVTSGQRDDDGRATSAAVVVRASVVALRDCILRDNIGDSATVASVVVGIAGVAGREGAEITVERCRIERNSWDGIALYRGARAVIRDNVIDGVDKASGARVGGGRGVGIGLTWNAQAVIEGNLVRRYWKGIGVFVNASAEVRENIVEEILTWGLAYWSAGEGEPVAHFDSNIIYDTGACGAMISRERAGSRTGALTGNLFVRTTQNPRYDSGEPYCEQRPIARSAVPASFAVADNLVHDTRQPGPAPKEPELSREALMRGGGALISRLAERRALRESFFLSRYGSGSTRND
jgi:hypothetical protein